MNQKSRSLLKAAIRVAGVAMMLSLVFVIGPFLDKAQAQAPATTFAIDDSSAPEAAGTMTFTVRRSGAPAAAVVDYQTVDGTAHAPSDYTHTSGSLTFAPNQSSQTITVPIHNDATLEKNNEYLQVQLLTVTPGPPTTGITDGLARGTIIDNDVALNIWNAPSIVEGTFGDPKNLSFKVSVATATANDVSFSYSTSGGTATPNADYVPVTNRVLTIPAGQTSVTATVTVLPDRSDEPAESVHVRLDNAVNATIADGVASGTIVDDDLPPQMSVSDIDVVEGDSGTKPAVFTVSLTAPSAFPISVTYTTSDDTAIAGQDYVASAGTLNFAPGQTSHQVSVPVMGDTLDEISEFFNLNIGPPTNASRRDATGRARILDNEDPPVLSISDASVGEKDVGGAPMTFTISLSGQSDRTVTLYYTTREQSATEPEDYISNYGTLTFAPGETTKTKTVIVQPDSLDEDNETFLLDQLGVVNATFGRAGTGTIIDNDPQPSVAVADVVKTEGTGGTSTMNFPLTLSAPSGRPVTVVYRTTVASATAGSDYQEETNASVTFAPGQTSINAPVSIVPDSTDEGEETLSLTIVSATNAGIADGSAQGTIVDDDAAPTVSVGDVTVDESDGAATFTVSISAPSAKSITVNFATGNGTATAGSDYVARTGSVTFAPGEASKEVSVTIVGDTLSEPTENFFLNVTGTSNATVADGQGEGTITDDDPTA